MFQTFLAVVALIYSGAAAAAAVQAGPKPGYTVFRHVNVLSVESGLIQKNRDVLIGEDGILDISESLEVPAGALEIDASGKYLMPGLVDMHTHLNQGLSGADHLPLYLAYGVTSVRSLSGTAEVLAWSKAAAEGQLVSPSIYTTGPTIVGLPADYGYFRYLNAAGVLAAGLIIWIVVWIFVRLLSRSAPASPIRPYLKPFLAVISAAMLLAHWIQPVSVRSIGKFLVNPCYSIVLDEKEARREVRRQYDAGYSAIKVYDFLTDGAYLGAVDEAKKHGMYVIGHIPDQLSLDAGIGLIDELAHLDELLNFVIRDFSDNGKNISDRYEFDYSKIPAVVARVRERGIPVVSNLVAPETVYRLLEDKNALLSSPEYSVIPEQLIEVWKSEGRAVNWDGQQDFRRDKMQPILVELLGKLHDAGVVLTAGTDVSVEGMVPGYHLIRDLEIMVESGFPEIEALSAATRNAAEIIAGMTGDGNWGTIAPGQRADLLLLEGNPLEDFGNLRRQAGVMVRGEWYARAKLDELVEAFRAGHR